MAPDYRPLLNRFPQLRQSLAPTPLCDLPTPVQHLSSLGGHAWVKRDDISAAEYGGNKMRKLEFILSDMERQGARRVVTLGATGTNAGVAAALACQQSSRRCDIYTFPQPETETVRKNRALMARYGARCIARRNMLSAALSWYLHPGRLLPGWYFLYAGCSNPPATFAYINAVMELAEQVRNHECPAPAEIIVAAGSGATVAGLAIGCALALPHCTVTAVQVAPARLGPFAVCHPNVIEKMQGKAWKTLRDCDPTLPERPVQHWVWEDRYYGDGYGVSDAGTEKAMAVGAAHGLALDPTYSGKAFDCFLDTLDRRREPVMFWHTYSSAPAPEGLTATPAGEADIEAPATNAP